MGRVGVMTMSLVFGLVATAGCSQTVAGTAVPSPGAVPRLDTGNYPTEPDDVKARVPADAWQQEGWRIADAVVAPWEVAPDYAERVDHTMAVPIISTAQFTVTGLPTVLFGDRQSAALVSIPPLTGFATVAAVRTDSSKQLATGILRFSDGGSAQRAFAAVTASESGSTDGVNVPGVRILRSDTPSRTIAFAAVRGDLLVMAGASGEGAATVAATAMSSQWGKSEQYRGTPNYGGIPDVPMDKDAIRSLPLPLSSEEGGQYGLSPEAGGLLAGYRSGYAHALNTRSSDFRAILTEGAIDLVAVANHTVVYRSASVDGASMWFDRLISASTVVTVPGLRSEVSRCGRNDADTDSWGCGVKRGRYVAVADGRTRAQAQQAAAALYLRLEHAPA